MADNTEENVIDLNGEMKVRREKLAKLTEEGKNPYQITKFSPTASAKEIAENYDSFEGKEVVIAGRMMSKRIMGKASFAHVMDDTAMIQAYVSVDSLGAEDYAAFKTYDRGDILGITGEVFKTKSGEVSVKASKIVLLSKSLRPLPEKWHGLKDVDTRYRQRYIDLIVNPQVRDTFRIRSAIISSFRRILDEQGFLEVETPVLQTSAGGATARPFITHHNTLDIDMYLRIATELHLKRLIVGGFNKVYEIGRIFRNEGMDTKHNPEFTTIEMYEAFADYHDMMDITERLIRESAEKILGRTVLNYQGVEIDLSNFRRMTMIESVREYAGIDFDSFTTGEEAAAALRAAGIPVEGNPTWGEALSLAFDEKVEDQLIQPTFITDHPIEVSPLAKKSKEDPRLTYRFELFMTGREYANAFSELNDPLDQKERFMAQAIKRANGDEEAQMMDEDFVEALEVGMPPTGGMGLGIDRLAMLFTDSATIRDVILFPTMKPIDTQAKPEKAEAPVAEKAAPVEEAPIDFSKVEIEPLFADFVDFDTFSKSDFRAVKVKACEAVPKSKKLLRFTLDDGTGTDRTILSGIHAFYEPEELVGKTLIAITNLPPRAMMGIESCGMLLSAIHTEEGEEKLHLLMVDNHIPAGAKLY